MTQWGRHGGARVLGAVLAASQAGCAFFSSAPAPEALLISRLSDARWTATTYEAASAPAHRRRLNWGTPVSIIGEVVDVSCFLQLGKRGPAHAECGQQCIRNGQPVGILTDHGDLYLVIPEEHHPRRDGHTSIKERFAELMGRRVEVSGMLARQKGSRALFVRTLPMEE